jgi:uncharacterized membrane protein
MAEKDVGAASIVSGNRPVAGRFKAYFLRGLAVLLPTVVTIGIFIWGYTLIRKYISCHIADGLQWLIERVAGTSFITEHLDEGGMRIALEAAGFLLALIAVVMLGALLASVVGRTLWRMIEKFIMNTPFLRQVYPYAKQVTDFLLNQDPEMRKKMFSRVVAVEYPKRGIWSVGLVTGTGLTRIVENEKKEFLTVLVPTSPSPITGFVIVIPKEDTIDLAMTIEEAFRFIISGGVITPPATRLTTPLPAGEAPKPENV